MSSSLHKKKEVICFSFCVCQAALEVGIDSITKNLSPDITEEELLQVIDDLNNDDSVDGILVQLPVPMHINERRICNSVSCEKDVDGFNEKNVGRLCLDMNTLIPCTPLGKIRLASVCLYQQQLTNFNRFRCTGTIEACRH